MDTEADRFPNLKFRRSTPSELHRSSNYAHFACTTASQSLSRFPSLNSTRSTLPNNNSRTTLLNNSSRTTLINSPISTILGPYGDFDRTSRYSNVSINVDRHPKFSLSTCPYLRLPQGDYMRLLCVEPGIAGSPLNCALFVAEIPEYENRFTALSYVWGRDESLAPIFINGRVQNIRRNLHAFICTIRSPHHETLIWVDAVCIDQQSIMEKNHQVKIMHKIYSTATCTRAWLGEDMPVVAQAMCDFRETLRHSVRGASDLKARPAAQLLLPLINHEYWSRTWIIQEILLAKEVWVHCGNQSLCWTDLLHLARASANQPNAPRVLHLKAFGECVMMHLHKMRQSPQPRGLPELLRNYGTTLCEDVRDRVFALIGLIDDSSDPLHVEDAAETINGNRNLVNYASSPKALFFQLLRLYPYLPVHDFALPLWNAFHLDYAHFDTTDLSQVLLVQGFPTCRLTMTRTQTRSFTQGAAQMNVDGATHAEVLSFSSPIESPKLRYSRVSLNINVKSDDHYLSNCYLASACSIEPHGLVLARRGYDLLCQAFDGSRIQRREADRRGVSIWVIEISVAALKALNAITSPADNQYFLRSIQTEDFGNNAADASLFQWITTIRQLPNMRVKDLTVGIYGITLPPERITHDLLLTEPSESRSRTTAEESIHKRPKGPVIVVRDKMRHKIVKASHLTRIYNFLTRPLHGDVQFVYK